MSQSPSPAGGEKPGFGGFFQVYLLAAVILMIYYTIDFQVSVSPALPGLTSQPSASRPHHLPQKPQPGIETPGAAASIAISAPPELATPPAAVPQEPVSTSQAPEMPATSSAPASEPTPSSRHHDPEPQTPAAASETAIPAVPESADAASPGLMVIDNPLPQEASETSPETAEPAPVSPEVSSTPDALTIAPAETASSAEPATVTATEATAPIPAASSTLPEVGQ